MNNKAILSALACVYSTSLLGAIGPKDRCRVASVNESENFLEEGLGTFGRADGDSQEFYYTTKRGEVDTVHLGQGRWTNRSGNITLGAQGSNQVLKVAAVDGNDGLKVVIYPSDRGIVLKTKDDGSTAVLASLDCLNVADVATAAPGESNVKLLSDSERRAIPEKVRKEMALTDVPYELGDGYYDVRSTELYQVISKTNSSQILGYVEIYDLYYTEGDDVIATVRFDRNGLRLGEIETESP